MPHDTYASITRFNFLLLISVFFLHGCTLSVPKNISQHIVMSSGQGEPVAVEGEHNIFFRSFVDYPKLSPEDYDSHINELLTKMRSHPKHDTPEGKKRKVLFFIHGGLNTQTRTIERAIELSHKQSLKDFGYYPIFINWQSSLFSSYRDHLLNVRQGRWRNWGPILSPLYFAGDFLRSIVRAPLTWFFMFKNDLETVVNFSDTKNADNVYLNAEKPYRIAREHNAGEHPQVFAISKGIDQRTHLEEFLSGLQYFITIPTKLISAPIIDAMGTSSWDIMLRRTTNLFHREGEFDKDAHRLNSYESGDGALSIFLRKFMKEVKKSRQEWEITLVGHSMGGIIINEILQRFNDLHFDNIVYMGAASTVRQYEGSLYPYLKNPAHSETQVYHLVLNEEAEVRERWEDFPKIFDLPPRGSLLVWIDNFLSKPVTPLDRTLGRWSNLLGTLRNTPKTIRNRIHIKAFGVGHALQETDPQEHGDLSLFPFWDESYWKPRFHL